MHRSNTQQHHGIVVGLLLALGAAGIGFLLQADLARAISLNEKHFLAAAGLMAGAILLVVKVRSRP
jgi:hypothetical protein